MKHTMVALAALAMAAAPASAEVVTLTFEGIGDVVEIGSFYGPDYSFSADALALESEESGGSGNFTNAPSGIAVMAFLDSDNAILDVANGFTDGFSFYYSSNASATVTVWDGLGGTGNLLGQINLLAQSNAGCEDNPYYYCNWSAAGIDFTGTAYSINFGGAADNTAYDNITFGDRIPGNGDNGGPTVPGIPEPATWAMLILGFGLVGGMARRRRLAPRLG